jgi:hypothetical protein
MLPPARFRGARRTADRLFTTSPGLDIGFAPALTIASVVFEDDESSDFRIVLDPWAGRGAQ